MRIVHAARTDVGMKRDNNEDNLLVYPEQHLFCVFDGMGGHAAGEVASGIAVREIKEFFELTGKDPDATWPFKDDRARTYDENRLVTAIKLANARIMEASEQDTTKKNMGTTCVTLLFGERNGEVRVLVAHAGDSRGYLLRDNKLKRITVDHSLVEEYLRMGKISEEEAKNFPQKNIILRALGQQRQVDVEINAHDPRPGDLFMLCSDGLSGMVEDKFMESILLKQSGNLEACAKKLLDTANANGGVDNSTVILVRYEGA
ncbi:MAG: Stp1/IreP family PP2C-type Ser/Thr phosphatase [Deltaproteobacteria bacterium]|nr:MAG: Stp1/IreP family PP2C-type Ser/Thr phosphatase [Deltaproteobacteria bacterium]